MPNYPQTIPAEYAEYEEEYRQGWNHGHGLACHNVPRIGDRIDRSVDYVGCGATVTAENIREYHELLCFATEENSRCYSPFEFTAHDLNSADDLDDDEAEWIPGERWEAFDAGTADSIRADLAEYTDEDYGIGDDE